ncbi:MAG: c-type cytochrome, partial [Planctomycetaceae bacterium]
MKTPFTTISVLMLSSAWSAPLVADDFSKVLRSAFQAHCIKCHGQGGKTEGKIDLLSLKSVTDLQARPKLLETLITVLKDREMPPKDEPALSDEKRQRMVARLQALLDHIRKTQAFGATPIRRMNRFQYNNAVVDLLEL